MSRAPIAFERTDLASTDGGAGAAAYLIAANPQPQLGDTVDRYLLVAALGEGAMGVVFRATDGDLRRDVALKLLRTAAGDEVAARARLLDEARAMARLHHPGVVAVYDVGTAGGHDFVAMELVAGTTLAAWMKVRRPWREVVARFITAGRGLAAAHAAGLVHRDFKPHNVLCGDDGRIAVADFGLAVMATPAGDDLDGAEATTRGVAGTPAYMAPEQHRGGVVDARTDQFAFCVALFEALFGVRPFTATSLDGLRLAIGRGAVLPPDAGKAGIPARLRRAVLRGLAEDPAARHPTLPALLDELAAILAARRHRVMAGVAALAIAGGVATTALLGSGPPTAATPACRNTRFAAVWPGAARARVEAALALGPDVQHTVLAGLDGYAARWDARWGALCSLEPADSPAFHAVAGCLLDGRDQAAVLIDELPRLTADTLASAVPAIERLPEPDGCAAPTAERPASAATRTEIRALEAELARLRGGAATRPADRRAAAEALLARARTLGFRPLVASVLTELAYYESDDGEQVAARGHYTEAALVAEEAGATDVRAEALVLLSELEASYSSDAIAQGRAARQATAALEVAPSAPRLRARLLLVRARLAKSAGDFPAALRFADEAIALREREGAHVALAEAVLDRARILRAAGDPAAALAAIDAELPRLVAAAGNRCGVCLPLMFDAAFALHELGRHDEAQARTDAVLALFGPATPPTGPRHLTGKVVDRARRPVAGATVLAIADQVRGDPTHLVQPSDRNNVAYEGFRTTTDAAGHFTLEVSTAELLLIGEGEASGRSLMSRVPAGDTAAAVTVVLEPWATLHGELAAPFDTHVHLTPSSPPVAAPNDLLYRVEVPIVGGRWSARVPAVPTGVRVVRSDVRFETILEVVEVRPHPGEDLAVALAAPGDVELVVRVRGDRAVEVPHAGLMMLSGHLGERIVTGTEMMKLYAAERGAGRVTETVPDGEGGSYATLARVAPGAYTVCVAAVPGDLHDPSIREKALSHPELLEGPCRHVDVKPAPARQELSMEVPPPRRLP